MPGASRPGWPLAGMILLAGILLLALPGELGRATYSQEKAAVKAISTIHTAETQFDAQFGRYATTLAQLGPTGAKLIDKGLASGETGGFKFVLNPTLTGYALAAQPTTFGSARHTYYSDQDMTIHQHNGKEPGTRNDPLLGDPVPHHPQM